MKPWFLLFVIVVINGCGSAPKDEEAPPAMSEQTATSASHRSVTIPANQAPSADKRSRGKEPKRPSWIDTKNPFQIKGGYVFALGQTVTPPGAGIEEGYIIASNAAKEEICKATEYRLDFIFQDSEEGSSVDHKQIKDIGMEVCNDAASHTKPGRRYWEKVMTTASNGDRVVVYRVFVTDVIPEKKFMSLVSGAIKKHEGKGNIPKDYVKQFRKRWARFAQGE